MIHSFPRKEIPIRFQNSESTPSQKTKDNTQEKTITSNKSTHNKIFGLNIEIEELFILVVLAVLLLEDQKDYIFIFILLFIFLDIDQILNI